MTYQIVLSALVDPTRRAVFESLLGGEQTVGQLAKTHQVSGPAISQHLKVLREAELAHMRAEGTRNMYSINREGLRCLKTYLDGFWSDALGAYHNEIERRNNEGY